MPKTIKNLQESFDSHSSRKCHLFFETTIWWFPEIVLQCYPQIIHFDWIVHDINQQYVWIPPFMETPIYFAIKIMGVSSQFLHDFMETPIYFASFASENRCHPRLGSKAPSVSCAACTKALCTCGSFKAWTTEPQRALRMIHGISWDQKWGIFHGI